MDLYLNPEKITEIIGVEEEIIKRTLERRDDDLVPYLRVVSASTEDAEHRERQIELRMDGLALLIKKLSYNMPTDDIIENLICQVFHITHLRETCEKLETANLTLQAENEKFIKKNEQLFAENKHLQTEKAESAVTIHKLVSQLEQERAKSRTWFTRLFNKQ